MRQSSAHCLLLLLLLLVLSVACCLYDVRRRAKYELKHVVRTHLAANDAAFNCVVEQEDKEGVRGVTLSKELMAIAGGDSFARAAGAVGACGPGGGSFGLTMGFVTEDLHWRRGNRHWGLGRWQGLEGGGQGLRAGH